MSVSNIIEPVWTIFYGIFRLYWYNGTMTSLLNSSFFVPRFMSYGLPVDGYYMCNV